MPQYLFVYGTLKSSFQNEMSLMLRSNAKFLAKAHIYGKIYKVDWYPALILSEDKNDKVFGEVYGDFDPSLIKILDEYECFSPASPEESEYIRSSIHAISETEAYLCHVYIYNQSVNQKSLIASGDF